MGLYQVTISMLMHGVQMNNVFHFSGTDTWTNTVANQLAVEVRDTWINKVKNEHTADVVYNNINVRLLGTDFAPFNLPISIAGVQGGHPNNQTEMAYVVRKRTNLIGRKNRGRIYIPGAQASSSDNGFLQQVRITNITTQLATANAQWCGQPGSTSQFRMVVKHKTEGFESVTALVVAPQYSMLHSRRVGIGV